MPQKEPSPSTLPSPTLSGKRIAFTGRLASMTRAEGVRLIRAHGGFYTARVTSRTNLLVVGQDGWPLQEDGRPSVRMRQARVLQRTGHAIVILSEAAFLCSLGQELSPRRLYDTAELSRLLGIPGGRLRRWMAHGLVRPVEVRCGIAYFDYSQLAGARTLAKLLSAGVKAARLRRSLRQLHRWLGPAGVGVVVATGDLLVRRADGLVDPAGQRCFDFSPEEPPLSLARPVSAEEWFERGCRHEDAGELSEAAAAYEECLRAGGPDAACAFNLGNVLYALGQRPQAAARFSEAVSLDRSFIEAWNNFGVVLWDLGRRCEAESAFERALALNPTYADGAENLGQLRREMGERETILRAPV